jgi:hypothetical protein
LTLEEDGSAARLSREISSLERKLLRLADAYISEDIGRDEYRALKIRCDEALSMLRAEAAEQDGACGDNTGLVRAADALSGGSDGDPDFYLDLTEKILVDGPDSFTVYLKHQNGGWHVGLVKKD